MKDSGVEWLGKVPCHWVVAQVKRRYMIQLGKMLQTTPNNSDDARVPYLKAKDVQWFDVRTAETSEMWSSRKDVEQFGIACGDLLVCEGGEGGRCGILREEIEDCIIQNALHRVRPREQDSNDFLQYVLRSVAETGWFNALNNKATIAHFTREKFGALRVPIPPVSEQVAIVRVLDRAERRIRRYIRAKERLIKLLEEHKKAIIHQAVTGQIDVRTGQPYPAYKDSGVEWLGEVPKHWDIQRLCQCASIVGGMTPSMENHAYWNGSIPWVTPKDMKLNAVGNSAIKVTQNALKETSLRLIHTGSVLMVVRGMILARTVPIAWTTCPVTVNQDMKALRPVSGINAQYMARALASAQDILLSFVDVAGHGTRRLPTDRWRALPLAIPPTDEQMAVVSYLDRICGRCDDLKNSTKREIELLREYRTRLIADIVTGKLDVREVVAGLPDAHPVGSGTEAIRSEANSNGTEHVMAKEAIQ